MIKPIETHYKGYRFRSRLEARHAVLFDSLDIPFEYEKEGYDLGGGIRYLPDFWLPDQKCWVEVKGEEPDDNALEKAGRLAMGTEAPVYMMIGEPDIPNARSKSAWRVTGKGNWSPLIESIVSILQGLGVSLRADGDSIVVWDDPGNILTQPMQSLITDHQSDLALYLDRKDDLPEQHDKLPHFWLTECVFCGGIYFSWFGCMQILPCGCMFCQLPPSSRLVSVPNHTSPRLLDAYEAARQARFEFGR